MVPIPAARANAEWDEFWQRYGECNVAAGELSQEETAECHDILRGAIYVYALFLNSTNQQLATANQNLETANQRLTAANTSLNQCRVSQTNVNVGLEAERQVVYPGTFTGTVIDSGGLVLGDPQPW
jgi:hypothetical protein